MNDKKYEKRLELQQNMISIQSKKIKELESQVENLKLECKRKDEIINSVVPLRDELTMEVAEAKKHKKRYKELIDELETMKEIINQEVYKGRWRIIKFLLK